MIYQILDKKVYLNSRYELVSLLQERQITIPQHPSLFFHNNAAHHYESYIDKCFPHIPYSEERLALFLHLCNNSGLFNEPLKHALISGNRTQIWFALRYPEGRAIDELNENKTNDFYIAEIFGLFDGVLPENQGEIESVIAYVTAHYPSTMMPKNIVEICKKYSNNTFNVTNTFATISLQQSRTN